MKIEERLVRQSNDDKIYIGDLIERSFLSEFGAALSAIIEALKTRGLTYHRENPQGRQPLTADRILGRLEGYQEVINELEQAIEVKNSLLAPIDEEDAEDRD